MRRNAKSCLGWSIGSTKGPTTGQRTRTNPRDCARRTCDVLNQPNRRNAFSPLIAPIAGHFQPRRHRLSAQDYHAILQNRFQIWNEVTGVKLVLTCGVDGAREGVCCFAGSGGLTSAACASTVIDVTVEVTRLA